MNTRDFDETNEKLIKEQEQRYLDVGSYIYGTFNPSMNSCISNGGYQTKGYGVPSDLVDIENNLLYGDNPLENNTPKEQTVCPDFLKPHNSRETKSFKIEFNYNNYNVKPINKSNFDTNKTKQGIDTRMEEKLN